MLFGILGWIILGLFIGFIASKFVNLRNDDPGIGIGLAAIAAAVGGGLYNAISRSAVSAFNVWSLLFAGIAAIGALVTWHVLRARASRTTVRRSW